MAYRKLGVRSDHRNVMLRNMVRSLFINEKIMTTDMRAKEAKRLAEKLVTLAKQDNLHARRQAFSILRSEDVVKKLFVEIAPRYADRNGGYTRIIKAENRRGDAAPMALLELVK